MNRLLDKLSYARSLLITAPLIFLYTGIMGSFSVASSLIDSRGRIQHACSRIWARMILWTARVRVRVHGLENVKPGGPLLALPSAGLHTNGYSLARKLVFEVAKVKPDTYVAEVGNKIGAELLKPHLCYAPALRTILANGWVSALAHITGGGIPGNLPRVLPAGVKAVIDLASWPVLPIFKYLAKLGKMDSDSLLESFNLGVGMILVVPSAYVKKVEADRTRHDLLLALLFSAKEDGGAKDSLKTLDDPIVMISVPG